MVAANDNDTAKHGVDRFEKAKKGPRRVPRCKGQLERRKWPIVYDACSGRFTMIFMLTGVYTQTVRVASHCYQVARTKHLIFSSVLRGRLPVGVGVEDGWWRRCGSKWVILLRLMVDMARQNDDQLMEVGWHCWVDEILSTSTSTSKQGT